jgi:hypothetical protein
MKTTRRDFIKTTGLGSIGLSILPSFYSFAETQQGLPRKSPESQGISSEGIRNFLKAIKESGLEWHSFMLLRHGNVVAEGWWKPFAAENKHTLYSLSKSFTSSAIGFLVNESKISVEDQVIKFFPDETPTSPSENLKAMKIKHLLTMNTGHHADSMPDIRAKPEQSWVKSFLEKPVEHEPSTFFMYNTGATYMLGAILHKVTGQTLEEYLQKLKDRRTEDDYKYTDEDFEKNKKYISDCFKNEISVYKCLELMYFAEKDIKQTATSILREYIQFDDVNQSKTIEILPLTIIDAMEEYSNQQEKNYSEQDMNDYANYRLLFKNPIKPNEWFEKFKKK